MRTVLISLTFFIVAAAPAAAYVPHVVQPGETLWGIAAVNNFTTRSFAAFNGLSETSPVVAGTTLRVPSVGEASAVLQGTAPVASAPAAAPGPSPRKPMGGYMVRRSDSLTALASRAGVSVSQMAYMNGLDPNG